MWGAAAAGILAAAGCYDSRFGEPGPGPDGWTPTERIGTLRKRYAGTTVVIDADIVVEGRVTTSDRSGNFFRSFCIEQEGAALEVMAGIDYLHNDYPPGSLVSLRLRGLALGTSREVLQVGRPPAPGSGYPTDYIGSRPAMDRVAVRIGSEQIVAPQPTVRTIGELDVALCGTLVRIDGLRYTPEELSPSEWSGYKRFTDASGAEIFTYVRRYADFADNEVPPQAVSLTGILQHDATNGGRYILKLRDETDCRISI